MAKGTKNESRPGAATRSPQTHPTDFDTSRFCEGAEHHGLPPSVAKRLGTVVANFLTGGGQAPLSIRAVMKDPEGLLNQLREGGPRSIATNKRRNLSDAVILAKEDAVLLAEILAQLLQLPPYVSGRDLYSKFSRAGPPSALSLGAPKDEPHLPAKLEDTLRRNENSD